MAVGMTSRSRIAPRRRRAILKSPGELVVKKQLLRDEAHLGWPVLAVELEDQQSRAPREVSWSSLAHHVSVPEGLRPDRDRATNSKAQVETEMMPSMQLGLDVEDRGRQLHTVCLGDNSRRWRWWRWRRRFEYQGRGFNLEFQWPFFEIVAFRRFGSRAVSQPVEVRWLSFGGRDYAGVYNQRARSGGCPGVISGVGDERTHVAFAIGGDEGPRGQGGSL